VTSAPGCAEAPWYRTPISGTGGTLLFGGWLYMLQRRLTK
jgi:hypothetical protein